MSKFQTITVRVGEETMQHLSALQRATGLNQSQVVRQLIRNAKIEPVRLTTSPTAAPTQEKVPA